MTDENENQTDDENVSKGTVVREGRSDADPLGIRRRRGGSAGGGRKRSPAFTGEEGYDFDYKDPQQLKYFISDRGKITPRRVSGLTAKQQRTLTLAVKRARNIALLPYTTSK